MQTKTIDMTINPWRNVYWFCRMLISSDKYGSPGKNSKLLASLTGALRSVLDESNLNSEAKLQVCRDTVPAVLKRGKTSKTSDRILLFCQDLVDMLNDLDDVRVFVFACDQMMIPVNSALISIPSDDLIYTQARAKAYLDTLGESGLATVIRLWDDLGVEGCLNAERVAVIREFANLRRNLQGFEELDADIVLTTFVQEFERRLGQKRKSRAGGSLEDVTSFLFQYYGIRATEAPEHFQADIEVDKWIKTKDQWLIGVSCKRTLRERWKQVSSADSAILSRYKIRQVWHVVTYDEDLSDDKITSLGGQRHVFYLRDDSRILQHATTHIGMKEYVRPMSKFIDDIKQNL